MATPALDKLASLSQESVRKDLKLNENFIVWAESWDRSAKSCQGGDGKFLDERALLQICAFARMSPEVTDALLAAAAQIRLQPAAVRLLLHYQDCIEQGQAAPSMSAFAELPESLGESGRLFYALLCLACVPKMRELHAARSIDSTITSDTLADIEIWMQHHRQRTGRWGFREMVWLMKHLTGNLVRLGRLQYEPAKFGPRYHVYTNTKLGVVAMPEAGLEFRDDGQYVDADCVRAASSWKSEFTADERIITGHVVSPRGSVRKNRVTLDASAWTSRLQCGDMVLNMHIPASGPMEETLCRESLSRAIPFFASHFREHTIKGFMCASWLLDPQLGDVLPGSNLARFLALFHLLPQPGAKDAQLYERVFGSKPADLKNAPRDTSLRRAVLDHELRGGRWRDARGFILPEEVKPGGKRHADFSGE